MTLLARRSLISLLATAVLAALAALPAGATSPRPVTPATPTAIGSGGGASTVDATATQAAIDTLRRGGNAIDATVAAAGVLGVTEPFSDGIGGGGFMLIRSARDGRVHTIDSREAAPEAMDANAFAGLTTFDVQRVSGMSVGVPGTVRAWQKALDEYGTWPLRKALRPGIHAAAKGFTIDDTFFGQVEDNAALFADFPATAAIYLDADGTPHDVGAVQRNPDLARTYELIARKGADAFYGGKLADAIVATVKAPPLRPGAARSPRPGVMELSDLAGYRALDRKPTRVRYRGYDVFGMGPPSSGGSTIGEALNILEGYPDLGTMPRERALHLYIEALRLAYADRGEYLGDPDYVDVPLDGLLSDGFAAQRRALIGETAATSPVAAGDPSGAAGAAGRVAAQRDGSTTHLTVSDRWGNAVSYTFTIEQIGGAGMVVPGYGFLLNNELTDFNLDAAGVSTGANGIEGGKRPRSSMSPTIVLRKGRPFLAIGSPGGSTIITSVLQTLINRIDFGLSLPDAIAAPRISQRNGAKTDAEPEFLAQSDIVSALQARGQAFNPVDYIGVVEAIEFGRGGDITAAAEPVRRGGGSAAVVQPGH